MREEHDLELRFAYIDPINDLDALPTKMKKPHLDVDHEASGPATLKPERTGVKFLFNTWYTRWSYDDVAEGEYTLKFTWKHPGATYEDLLEEQSLED
jgi:hypothetical protein